MLSLMLMWQMLGVTCTIVTSEQKEIKKTSNTPIRRLGFTFCCYDLITVSVPLVMCLLPLYVCMCACVRVCWQERSALPYKGVAACLCK